MRVLVTGGAGFLGSHLVDALVRLAWDVQVLDNFHRGRLEHLGNDHSRRRITLYTADVRNYDQVLAAMDGVDLVYHLAAQSNVMGAVHDIDYSFSTNVVGTFNVLKAASVRGVRRVVFASSREVYGEPDQLPVPEEGSLRAKNPYGASKLAGEAYCRAWQTTSSLDCFILRFANLYGPRDRDRVIPIWLQRAREGKDLEVYGGQQVLDFLWVGHAVEALIAAAHAPNHGPVNVGSGRGVAISHLGERILELIGSRSRLCYQPARQIEVVRFVADNTKMRTLLGVVPADDSLAGLAVMATAAED